MREGLISPLEILSIHRTDILHKIIVFNRIRNYFFIKYDVNLNYENNNTDYILGFFPIKRTIT